MYSCAIEILDAAAKSTQVITTTNKDINNNNLFAYDCDFTKKPSCCERYLLRDNRHVCTHCTSRKCPHTHVHVIL